MIRCRVCGFLRKKFHGWVFAADKCYGETNGYKAMLHEWESVEE